MKPYIFLLLLSLSFGLDAQPNLLLETASTASASRQRAISEELRAYSDKDFSATAKRQLVQLLASPETGGRDGYLLLAGFLGMENVVRTTPANTQAEKRARNLALVRLGDTAKTENLLRNIARYKVDDDFVYTIIPLLIYTRSRPVFDYLWQQSMTEQRNCQPGDAETGGRIDCAYRIVEYLAPVIENFPVAHDGEGNLQTADYPRALAEIRRWYASHAQDYVIIAQTF